MLPPVAPIVVRVFIKTVAAIVLMFMAAQTITLPLVITTLKLPSMMVLAPTRDATIPQQ